MRYFVITEETCTDIPLGTYQCSASCAKLAAKGHCEDDWSKDNHCRTSPSGKIKDSCKLACNNCGKYLKI